MRLNFRLPEWSPRTIWSSAHAREVWQPLIQRISQTWIETERNLVAAGMRPSALQHVSPESLPALMQTEARRGLIVLPLAQVAKPAAYQSASVPLQPGASFDYKVAITRPEHAAAWADAWSRSDDTTIGKLLNYPECCREFFQRVWVRERWMDTTWAMSTPPHKHLSGVNMLWRWHGVRPVSHLPCSFACKDSSTQYAYALAQMTATHPEEAQWMEEILSWPVKWSALHGIAEIVTPISRTSVPTDATDERLEVRYMGTEYPAEGATGLEFPHRRHVHNPVTVPVSVNTLRLARRPMKWFDLKTLDHAGLNGFTTPEAMWAAHNRILTLVPGVYNTVLDLGCGDGTLLHQIRAKRRVGVEIDTVRADVAQKHLDRVIGADCTDPVVVARIIAEESPDLIIAQRDRNPLDTFPTTIPVLSYSYETGDKFAILRSTATSVPSE